MEQKPMDLQNKTPWVYGTKAPGFTEQKHSQKDSRPGFLTEADAAHDGSGDERPSRGTVDLAGRFEELGSQLQQGLHHPNLVQGQEAAARKGERERGAGSPEILRSHLGIKAADLARGLVLSFFTR